MESIFFLGLNMYAWITIIALASLIVIMIRSSVPVEVAFLSVVTILLVFGIVDEEEAMAGFGSEPVVVHGAFFVVMAGLMGTPKTYRGALVKLMVPISVLAAMLNSVNVVALFIDMVKLWARRLGTEPSRLLLPLSYAASLGGMCTLIGNSSNLVIAGLYADQTGESLNLFAPLLPAMFCTAIGIGLTILFSHRRLLLRPPVIILSSCWFRPIIKLLD